MKKRIEANALFFKFWWTFMIGCVGGDIIETIYCFITRGVWINRGSVLYGPFSLVWGTGAVLMAIFAEFVSKKKSNFIVFIGGFIIGGTHEYLSSLLSEIAFGTVNWDYSQIPFHIQGRTNLLFCVYWGLIAVIFVRLIYPAFVKFITKIPWNIIKTVTVVVTVFMILDIYVSFGALARYNERRHGIEASNSYDQFLDEHYSNEFITSHYPDIKVVR